MSLNKTGIEWTDFTWNPVTGCFNGCPYCYARDLAFGRLKKRYLANPHTVKFKRPGDPGKDPFWPRFWKDRSLDPESVPRNFKSRNSHLPAGSAMIFTVDMGDLFGPWVPETWKNEVLEVCEQYPKHIFQFLTKFPRELRGMKFPANSWVGTTVTRNSELDRIAALVTLYSFVKGLGKDNEVDINNAVFIAKTFFEFELPLKFRDGGKLGIESLLLYSLLDNLSDLKEREKIDKKAEETGKKLSMFNPEELRLMASYIWNEGKSSLFPEERKKAAVLIETHFGGLKLCITE